MKKQLRYILLLVVMLFSMQQPIFGSDRSIEKVWDKQAVVYVTKTGTKYHKGSCHHLRKSKIEISKKTAQERGYSPCGVCKP